MSKASEYADLVKKCNDASPGSCRLICEGQMQTIAEVLPSGRALVGRVVLAPAEALALADWIYQNFGEGE